ncbi:type II secretion system F family protein [Pseudoalteromonas piscicida]|uniref:type II secretion system F family protein n=1 Tax=Pseudoalteromonas piscicida TaxID=43662 RepID=UPI003C7EBE96
MSKSFKYKVVNESGMVEQGEVHATSLASAQAKLEEDFKLVLSVKENSTLFERNRVSLKELEEATSQLATLLHNGLRIDKAIAVLAQASSSSAIGGVWRQVLSDLKHGGSLSDSLADKPNVFPKLFVEMTKIGESTGTLPLVFERLSQNLRFQYELKSKVMQAATYPIFILIVCILAIWGIFTFVVPSMSAMFEGVEQVPEYTQLLLNMSSWVIQYQGVIFVALIGIPIGVALALQKHQLRTKLLNFLSGFPIAKSLITFSDRIRFSTALQLTLESGVSLSSSLELASETVINPQLSDKLKKTKVEVSSGESISGAVAKLKLFDEISLSLITVGEESGNLEMSFSEISRRSRQSFEQWLMKFTALLEPLLILIMGGIVGSVVIVMLLSIVSMNDVSF